MTEEEMKQGLRQRNAANIVGFDQMVILLREHLKVWETPLTEEEERFFGSFMSDRDLINPGHPIAVKARELLTAMQEKEEYDNFIDGDAVEGEMADALAQKEGAAKLKSMIAAKQCAEPMGREEEIGVPAGPTGGTGETDTAGSDIVHDAAKDARGRAQVPPPQYRVESSDAGPSYLRLCR